MKTICKLILPVLLFALLPGCDYLWEKDDDAPDFEGKWRYIGSSNKFGSNYSVKITSEQMTEAGDSFSITYSMDDYNEDAGHMLIKCTASTTGAGGIAPGDVLYITYAIEGEYLYLADGEGSYPSTAKPGNEGEGYYVYKKE